MRLACAARDSGSITVTLRYTCRRRKVQSNRCVEINTCLLCDQASRFHKKISNRYEEEEETERNKQQASKFCDSSQRQLN